MPQNGRNSDELSKLAAADGTQVDARHDKAELVDRAELRRRPTRGAAHGKER
jgi:hypothetical protein